MTVKIFCNALILILLIFPLQLPGQPPVTVERQKQHKFAGEPLAVKAFDPAFALFPDSSLVDFSYLLSPPAGKFGFVKLGEDGHFYFSENNQRARFWGIVVSQEHVDIPRERIAEIVETMARAGINMLRLHAMDNRGGEEYGMVRRTIIDEAFPNHTHSQNFNKDFWDRIDYWIGECKKRGIYVYLVLRGYRTFREGDGVPNAAKLDRAARPYAMFNRRLIELQKDYARKFMVEHINPYTGLSYANDPAIAAIEIFNEDSLFMRPDKWQTMVEPYLSEFRQLWNDWLRQKYGNTESLRKAWTNYKGECALGKDESLEEGTVVLPDMKIENYEQALTADYKDPLRSPVRRRDGAAFAIELQMKYLQEMQDYLRQIGVKVPLTGVVDSQIVADTFTVGEILAFTGENAYYSHPIFLPGKEWVGKAFYEDVNFIKQSGVWSLMPFISRYHWAERAIGVREWATCWPNKYRASSILEMAAYGRLQDLDLLTYFQYNTTGDFTRIGSFNITCDPARWLLFGLAAKIFLGDDISVAKHSIEIGYSHADLTAWASFVQHHHTLAWLSRVVNRYLAENTRGKATTKGQVSLMITSGRTHNVKLEKAEKSLIYSNCPVFDFAQSAQATGKNNIIFCSGYELMPEILNQKTSLKIKFEGLGLSKPVEKNIATTSLFTLAEVMAKGYTPFGITGDKCLGFYDAKRKNLIFSYLPEEDVPRWGAQLLNFWYGTPGNYFSYEDNPESWLVSDTNEIKRNTILGIETIDTPKTQVIQGEFEPDKEYSSSLMKIKTRNDFAVFVATSLDDLPLKESRYFVLKMVTSARNRGEKLEKANYPGRDDLLILTDGGSAPVQTGEQPCESPTVVELNGQKLIESYMLGGWWEAVFDARERVIYLASSGRNIKFVLSPPWLSPEAIPEFEETRYYYDTPPDPPTIRKPASPAEKGEVIYPAFQKYIRLRTK